jgi:O-antigen biosynthesis protein
MNKILIGILQHNKYKVTEKCINLLISNTSNVEYDILLLDNGSTDGSEIYIQELYKDSKIIMKFENKNHGVIGGRNLIFNHFKENAEYSHVLFLDNDQFVRPSWTDGYISAFNSFGDSVVGIEAWIMTSNLSPLRKALEKDRGYTYVGCGGMMIARSVVEKIGIYDEQFNPAYFEDPDYCLRAHRSGIPVVWNTKSKIDHLPHQTLGQINMKAKKTFQESMMKFRNKWKTHCMGGPFIGNII